jgi:hypothetical protein
VSETNSGTTIRESWLYRDLHLDHRDAMYRATTFIARQGGPPVPGDAKETLAAHRKQARDWLLAQEDPGDLLVAYERFVQSWSPVFSD